MSQTRRLAAILAADVAGYSRLIGADEGGTLQTFKTIREEVSGRQRGVPSCGTTLWCRSNGLTSHRRG